ncbi:hypothetical protein MUN88_03415 [Gracilibacillus caseinilyticus]|uniref:Uncharacterized protein n=1 Tax=Gracilibacillus caseinilyticus TaxID=2932256 RepID=A0ABY4EZ98_9BACI|nr:hypothetical protein [Gracilibacillus caseinilyticus]UOQ49188.1 hypothetical protein MUN88_03415 [Gracilibacillus caseinilyticus]
MAIMSFLVTAWVLSWFKFEQFFIQAFKELFNKDITKTSYYFIFFCFDTIAEVGLFFNGSYIDRL